METTGIILIAVLIIAAAVGFFLWRKSRSVHLRNRFGEEYDRMVQSTGSQSRAEKELEIREKRIKELKIHPLNPDEVRQFGTRWRRTQAFFVDEPGRAVQEADLLVKEVMRARGYPMGDFEQRAADISVNHPRVVTNYRTAEAIAWRNSQGQASTEELRQALVCYRELFEDLLEEPKGGKSDKKYEEAVR